MNEPFPCYMVRKSPDGAAEAGIEAGIEQITLADLPPGDVLIRVAYSSLNYKDALAVSGHPGVAKSLPLVPGIDAAGTVEHSESSQFQPGDKVLVTGYSMGESRWGGYSGYVRMPAENVVPLPAGLSLYEAMIYGTAGFTAAQSVQAILDREIDPGRGPVLVTGATGGVGSLAVGLLAKIGFQVTAVTGKADQHDYLRKLGATEIVGRRDVDDRGDRPLLSSRWSAAVDTVGGNILATILRSTMHRGVVTACGLVAGAEVPLTVYPFILRGVTLAGIDSAQCPMESRLQIWSQLAGPWKLDGLDALAHSVTLDGLGAEVEKILAGRVRGRIVVELGNA